jgi:hypothetical protein|tara:strand:+ start:1164 stop:1325 length:162 start_codon:yes stop_codon:yes gene_type:complete
METYKYMMAKAWMKQDKATPEEAIETWNKLEAEFNEERKQMLKALSELEEKIK